MSNNLEILVTVIMEEAFQEAEAILEKAEREAYDIREESLKKQAQLQSSRGNDQDHLDIFFMKAKTASQAELQARMEIIQAKETFLTTVLEEVKEEFFSLPKQSDYPLLLQKLIIDGLENLDGDQFVFRLNEPDRAFISRAWIKEIEQKMGKEVTFDDHYLPGRGGVIIQRLDGRLLYDNTLEAIFRRWQEKLRSIAAERLFE